MGEEELKNEEWRRRGGERDNFENVWVENEEQNNIVMEEDDDDELLMNDFSSLLFPVVSQFGNLFSSLLLNPSVRATRSFVLPTILSKLPKDISSRIKGWFGTVQSLVSHVGKVVGSSETGKAAREKSATVANGLVDTVSCSASRQVVVELAGTLVKLTEALHTPETKVALGQIPILACRLADAASSGPAKQLYHDASDLLSSLIDLAADPETTVAIAEITANICHMLEMEQAWYQPKRKRDNYHQRARTHVNNNNNNNNNNYSSNSSDNNNNTSKLAAAIASRRRRDRNRHIGKTYTQRVLLNDNHRKGSHKLEYESHTSVNESIEDAILSSLGNGTDTDDSQVFTNLGLPLPNESNVVKNDDDVASFPNTVLVTNTKTQHHEFDDASDDNDSQRKNCDLISLVESISDHSSQHDFSYLKEKIQIRTPVLEELHEDARSYYSSPRTTKNNNSHHDISHDFCFEDMDIEELDQYASMQKAAHNKSPQSPRMGIIYPLKANTNINFNKTTGNKRKTTPNISTKNSQKNDMPAMTFFTKTLEKLTSTKRKDFIDGILQEGEDKNIPLSSSSMDQYGKNTHSGNVNLRRRRKWNSKAAAAAGAGNERGQDTLRHELDRIFSSPSTKKYQSYIGMSNFCKSNSSNFEWKKKKTKQSIIYNGIQKTVRRWQPRYQIMLLLILIFIFLSATLWIGLGFYGIYALFYSFQRVDTTNRFEHNNLAREREMVIRIVHSLNDNDNLSKEDLETFSFDTEKKLEQYYLN